MKVNAIANETGRLLERTNWLAKHCPWSASTAEHAAEFEWKRKTLERNEFSSLHLRANWRLSGSGSECLWYFQLRSNWRQIKRDEGLYSCSFKYFTLARQILHFDSNFPTWRNRGACALSPVWRVGLMIWWIELIFPVAQNGYNCSVSACDDVHVGGRWRALNHWRRTSGRTVGKGAKAQQAWRRREYKKWMVLCSRLDWLHSGASYMVGSIRIGHDSCTCVPSLILSWEQRERETSVRVALWAVFVCARVSKVRA